MADVVRLDKYLWAIRLFKTRSEATDACKGNKVKVGGTDAKPSKMIKTGDTIVVRKGAALFTYRVKGLIERRVGAALVCDYAENLTPQTEIDKLHAPNETFFVRRDRGAGRPTKKDRREMDFMMDGMAFEDEMIPDDIAEHFGLSDDEL